jgi:peptidoglycan/LPS O-acetylase OafA/YrhL
VTSRLTAPPHKHHAEIDGIRGLAVSFVVLFHLGAGVRGGAVGVDVFFTISGFVITAALLREVASTGRVSLPGFAARRIRRLLPAAAVVTAATLVATGTLWFQPRFFQTILDAFAAATLVENWHLIGAGASYLHDPTPSPLQHLWSLAVEEQFYLAWPLVVILAVVVGRARRRILLLVAGVAILTTVVSIVVAASLTVSSPNASYFNTTTRLWEIALGCLCCVALNRLRHLPATICTWASSAGVALLVVTPLVVPSDSLPWPGAAPAVVGTALVLLCGLGGSALPSRALRFAPLRWLGLRSYSLYLWHFPLIVVATSVIDVTPALALVIAAATLFLSALTYRYIEVPFQRPRRVLSPDRTRKRTRTRTRLSPRATAIAAVAASTSAVLIVGCFAVAQVRGPGKLGDPAFAASTLGLIDPAPPPSTPPTLDELRRQLSKASAARSWPAEIRSQLDSAFTSRLPPAMDNDSGCRHNPVESTQIPRTCSWGDPKASRRAVVIGDSSAAAWTPAVAGALVPLGWRVDALSFSGCSFVSVSATPTGQPWFAKACRASRDTMFRLARQLSADLVLLSDSTNLLPFLESGAQRDAAEREWRDGTTETLRALDAPDRALVLLPAPPKGPSPAICTTRLSAPSACLASPPSNYHLKRDAESKAAAAARKTGVDAHYIDTLPWFCTGTRCPLFAGTNLIRGDASHLSERMSRALSDILREALDRLDVVPRR